jgi:hypothetical protein
LLTTEAEGAAEGAVEEVEAEATVAGELPEISGKESKVISTSTSFSYICLHFSSSASVFRFI